MEGEVLQDGHTLKHVAPSFSDMNWVRASLKQCWASVFRLLGLLYVAERHLARQNAIVVLTFHRVLTEEEFGSSPSPKGMLVKENTFLAFLEWAQRSVTVVAASDGPLRQSVEPRNKPIVAFTFDDGWHDNYVRALPALRGRQLAATVFVCSGCMGQKWPFWPERIARLLQSSNGRAQSILRHRISLSNNRRRNESAKLDSEQAILALKLLTHEERENLLRELENNGCTAEFESKDVGSTMSWEELAQMANLGVAVGSHTVGHLLLPQLAETEARTEILQSKRTIESEMNTPCEMFSYPNGSWSPEVRNMTQSAGYKRAFTNTPGVWTEDSDHFLIPRINVWEGTLVGRNGRFSPTMFRYRVLWKAWRWSRGISGNDARGSAY